MKNLFEVLKGLQERTIAVDFITPVTTTKALEDCIVFEECCTGTNYIVVSNGYDDGIHIEQDKVKGFSVEGDIVNIRFQNEMSLDIYPV